MKHLTMLLLSMLVMSMSFSTSAQSSPDAVVIMHPNAESDIVVHQYFQKAFEKNDLQSLEKIISPDAMIYGFGGTDSLTHSEFMDMLKEDDTGTTYDLSDEGPVLPVSVSEGPQKGNWVFKWGVNNITYANGEKLELRYHSITKVDDGKISDLFFYYDRVPIMKAMGYTITPPE